jgi:16S rRNA (guanine966-N2)-methyltransferase
MRIIAGTHRSRVLRAPSGLSTRPTSGRVRESLFSHLLSAHFPDGLDGIHVLDLFCGSGALALEAVSRGAASALLLDGDPGACRCAQQNVDSLGEQHRVSVVCRQLPRGLERVPPEPRIGLVFCDPPYGLPSTADILADLAGRSWLAPDALLVFESSARQPPALPAAWLATSTRVYGDTRLDFARLAPPPAAC